MSWILAAVLIAGSPGPRMTEIDSSQAAAAIAPELQTGSLIVCKGDCVAVKVFSGSAYTHVASIVVRNGQCSIYDSTSGAGVRRKTLEQFLASQQDATVHLFHPNQTFSRDQAAEFERHLESQLGRPYAIKHHFSGERVAGIHCAEYATDALIAADVITARQPARVSPASLVQGIEQAELYRHAAIVHLTRPAPVCPESAGWCGRLWFETKECTRTCSLKVRGWIFCK